MKKRELTTYVAWIVACKYITCTYMFLKYLQLLGNVGVFEQIGCMLEHGGIDLLALLGDLLDVELVRDGDVGVAHVVGNVAGRRAAGGHDGAVVVAQIVHHHAVREIDGLLQLLPAVGKLGGIHAQNALVIPAAGPDAVQRFKEGPVTGARAHAGFRLGALDLVAAQLVADACLVDADGAERELLSA